LIVSGKYEAPGRKELEGRCEAIYRVLGPLWPDARPLLEYGDCFELLCAVMLSAQCTDEQVNRVTPALFSRWPDAEAMAAAPLDAVAACVHSVGFYRTKARHLVETAALLVERHGGQVPGTMGDLLALPGVGRKTANLVLSACFGEPGIIVDTHVLRVALRLGLGGRADPAEIEDRISRLVPRERWTRFSHALNRHGKHVCTARAPACIRETGSCPIEDLCPRVGLAQPARAHRPGVKAAGRGTPE
jgi:endonuclease-3